jgi:hypothetical protein
MIYKTINVSIFKNKTETNQDYILRRWFVSKNIHLIGKCFTKNEILDMDMLIGFSYIHLKVKQYNHMFDKEVMDSYKELLKLLYI